MYIIKYAIKNLFRNKGRSVLLGVLLLTILIGISISMIIESSSKKVAKSYQESINVSAVLEVDYMSLISKADSNGIIETDPITSEMYKEYADSSYVKDCYTYGLATIISDDIEAVGTLMNLGSVILSDDNDEYEEGNLSLYGYDNLSQLTDFIDGKRKIIDGEVYSAKNECIISSELAEKNALNVGDTINVRTTVKSTSQTLQLTITGIYLDATPTTDGSYITYSQNQRNDVIVNMETMEQLNSSNYSVEGTFILSDPSKVDLFAEELKEKGLPSEYQLSADTDTYQQVIAPVNGLSQTARVFLIVIIIIGADILVFLSLLMTRERKYEIGILRARGLSKIKVALQFISENLLLAGVCLMVAMTFSLASAQTISDGLLEKQITQMEQQSQNKEEELTNLFSVDTRSSGFGSSNSETSISTIEVSFGMNEILLIVYITLVLSIISSLVAVVYIVKKEPMRILIERS